MTVNDVYPNELIEKVAEELKKIELIKPPVWAAFAKTGAHKERAPEEKDWWYKRAAAVLRSVSVLGPIGVSKLRTKYGGKKRRGHKKAHFKRGSGSVIRKILQQLQKAELIKFVEKGIHKGRVIAPKGRSLLDKTAVAIIKTKPKRNVKKAPEAPKEPVKKEAPAEKEAPVEKPAEKPAEEAPVAEKPKPEDKVDESQQGSSEAETKAPEVKEEAKAPKKE